MKDIKTNILLLVSNNHYISEQKYVKYLDFLPNKYFRGKQKLFDLLNKSNSILKLKILDSKAWADHHLMTKEIK
jgi:hypothetical protein